MRSFPRRLDELTPEWLDGVLHASAILDRSRVTGLRIEPIGEFSSELSRVSLEYDAAEPGAPASVVVKRPVAGGGESREPFARELRFYRELAPGLGLRTPRCHFARSDGADALLILEDVPGLQAFDFRAGAGDAQARAALAGLARLHADRWGRSAGLDWLPAFDDPERTAALEADYALAWPAQRGFLEEVEPRFGAIGEALAGRLAALCAPLAAPATLLHGDAHAENTPIVAGGSEARPRLCFLDWAGVRRGNPGFDVAVFNTMSFPRARRREREAELVALHADAVRAAGARWPEPWLDYRRGVLVRAAYIVCAARGWPRDPQALAALAMVARRSLAAAADLDALELTGR